MCLSWQINVSTAQWKTIDISAVSSVFLNGIQICRDTFVCVVRIENPSCITWVLCLCKWFAISFQVQRVLVDFECTDYVNKQGGMGFRPKKKIFSPLELRFRNFISLSLAFNRNWRHELGSIECLQLTFPPVGNDTISVYERILEKVCPQWN